MSKSSQQHQQAIMSQSQALSAFISHQVDGKVIPVREKDGYINATKLCKAGSREFSKYYENKSTKNYISLLSEELKISKSELIEITTDGPSDLRGTWVHPRVATHIACWISPTFMIWVTNVIEKWREQNKNNDAEYKEQIQKIKPSANKQKELDIQQSLQQKLGGRMEVENEFGRIDLLTDQEIIEIKSAIAWKHGLGQLLVYAEEYPNHKKRLHLFDSIKKADNIEAIEKMCKKFDIALTLEE